MKKLLGIVVLGLIFCNTSFASDIKIKRIECKIYSDKRFYNKFFIISENQKDAKLYRAFGWYGWNIVDLKIKKTLNYIQFSKGNKWKYEINRSDGTFYDYEHTNYIGSCFKMEDNFDPEVFLSENVKKHIADKEKSNKF